jgi:hypothetical protein
MKLKIFLFFPLFFVLCSLFSSKANAQSSLKSTNYEITWPNLNMAAGGSTSPGYKMGITAGQTSPGLYSSFGYKIRAGFQYIHSIIPFSFKISPWALNFGSLNPETLTNNQSLTLTVNSGSAGGYQVTAQENDPLTSTATSTIPDTTCDAADTCTHTDAGTWTQTTTYGFGYNMTGTDVPLEFAGGKYKNFPDGPGESPVKIMGKTPAPVEGHVAERNKIATMSARINIENTQAAGTYRNVLTFTAIPTY